MDSKHLILQGNHTLSGLYMIQEIHILKNKRQEHFKTLIKSYGIKALGEFPSQYHKPLMSNKQ